GASSRAPGTARRKMRGQGGPTSGADRCEEGEERHDDGTVAAEEPDERRSRRGHDREFYGEAPHATTTPLEAQFRGVERGAALLSAFRLPSLAGFAWSGGWECRNVAPGFSKDIAQQPRGHFGEAYENGGIVAIMVGEEERAWVELHE